MDGEITNLPCRCLKAKGRGQVEASCHCGYFQVTHTKTMFTGELQYNLSHQFTLCLLVVSLNLYLCLFPYLSVNLNLVNMRQLFCQFQMSTIKTMSIHLSSYQNCKALPSFVYIWQTLSSLLAFKNSMRKLPTISILPWLSVVSLPSLRWLTQEWEIMPLCECV